MKQKIYNLLMVTYRELLEHCYQQVFFQGSELLAVKTFEDYLADFYLYLYEAKPKYLKADVKGYYLSQIRDEEAMPAWLRQTFRHFLLEENKILSEMREALSEYRRQLATTSPGERLEITLMHIGFAIAWFNQHESAEDRYLFFRSAYKHFKGFYSWPDEELDDKDVATLLEITPGNLRTRTSRLCAKVKRLVSELNDALISALNKYSLDIASEIYAKPDPDMESILENLLGQAERDLEQYEQVLALRREKRLSIKTFERVESASISEMIDFSPIPLCDASLSEEYEFSHTSDKIAYSKEDSRRSSPKDYAQIQTARIIIMFKILIGM